MDPDYLPDFQVDVYGTIGQAFDNDPVKIGEYVKELAELVAPHALVIEGPVDCGSREEQIELMAKLREYVDEHNIPVKYVADEWCNTLEDIKDFVQAKAGHMIQIKAPDLGGINHSVDAVLYCHEHDAIPYLGDLQRDRALCPDHCADGRGHSAKADPFQAWHGSGRSVHLYK